MFGIAHVLGYTERELMNTSLHGLYAAWRFHQKRETLREQMAWERARWTAYCVILPHVRQGILHSPRDLRVFEWERETVEKERADEKAELLDFFKQVMADPERWKPDKSPEA